jgi:tripartite-type tricarboxylate transporter receptor subunit TctC
VGLEPVNRMAYYGIVGPKGLPRPIVDRVNDAARKSLADAGVAKRIADTGSLVIGNSPEDFARQIAAEFEVYRKVVAEQKLTMD